MLPPTDALSFPDRQTDGINQDGHELAPLGLAATLGAAHVVCAQLAARSRLQAATEPTHQQHAKAAFLHAAARFLHQACLVLDPGAEMHGWRDSSARAIQQSPEHVVDSLLPVVTIDEQAVLAEAMSELAGEAGELAAQASGPMAFVLTSVRACIEAAAGQLREAELFTRLPGADGEPA
jgi:hypothetical protein